MNAIRMPSLAENINEATVLKWLVATDDRVEPGRPVVELLTEKAGFTLEAETGGRVSTILAPPRSVMPVGSILCVLDASPNDILEARRENARLSDAHLNAPTVEFKAGELKFSGPPPGDAVRATPAARRVARENGLDLKTVADAVRPEGALSEADVRAYLERGAG